MFRIDEPAPAIVVGVRVIVAPVGNPETLSATVPLNPLNPVVVTV